MQIWSYGRTLFEIWRDYVSLVWPSENLGRKPKAQFCDFSILNRQCTISIIPFPAPKACPAQPDLAGMVTLNRRDSTNFATQWSGILMKDSLMKFLIPLGIPWDYPALMSEKSTVWVRSGKPTFLWQYQEIWCPEGPLGNSRDMVISPHLNSQGTHPSGFFPISFSSFSGTRTVFCGLMFSRLSCRESSA